MATATPVIAPNSPSATPRSRLERLGQQRERSREHDRAADSLAAPRDRQEKRARSQPAAERARCEDHDPNREQELPAVEVGQRAGCEQECSQRQCVGADHPLQIRQRRPERALDVGQRHVHDRDVEQKHEHARAHGRERPPLAGLHGWGARVAA
jgi:hypothetical protein